MENDISHKIGRKIITNMRGQERVKLRKEIDEPIRARTESSMIN
jgi:hypothetical protein